MALDGFTIGNTPSAPSKSPVVATVPSNGNALKGFAIGSSATKAPTPAPAAKVEAPVKATNPKVQSLINSITPADTSSLFSGTLNFSKGFAAPKISSKSSGSTQAIADPSNLDEYTGLPTTPVGASLGKADPNNKKQGVIGKIADTVQNFFQGTDYASNSAIQKTIVDKNLVDIGKQLGIDKQFPLDPTKDKITAQYYQDKSVADYVRNNYGDIKNSITDPAALPEHPEMLGPKYMDVEKNIGEYEKQLGIRSTPTNKEFLGYMLLAPVAASIGGAVAAGAGVGAATLAIDYAGFMAFSYVEHKILGDSIAGKISDQFGIRNSNVRDVLDLVEMLGVGGALHSVYSKAPTITRAFTKSIAEEYMPGQKVFLSPDHVFDVLSGKNSLTTAEQRQMFNSLGLTADQMKTARNNGVTIDIDPQKLTTLVDKPYWSKIKDLFGVKKGDPEVVSNTGGETKFGAEARTERLLGDGGVKTNEGAKILQGEIKNSITEHGEIATIEHLKDQLGIDSQTAKLLINETKANQAITDPAILAKTEGQNLSISKGEAPNALKGFEIEKPPALEEDRSPSVLQITDAKTGESTYQAIHKNDFEKFKDLIDSGETEKASSIMQRTGKSYHITATEGKDVNDMMERGNIKPVSGYADYKEVSKVANPEPTAPIEGTTLKPIEGTGETKTRGLAESVENKAIEKKLTDSFGDLPEYKTVNMKDQAARATDIINTDYEKAKRIALGHEIAPEGTLPEAVYVAVEKKAIADRDIATLRDLAVTSRLTAEATTMGQRIRTLGERDPDSPVAAIKSVSDAREKATSRRVKGKDVSKAKKGIIEDIKKEIKKVAPKKKEDWNDFIKSIQC